MNRFATSVLSGAMLLAASAGHAANLTTAQGAEIDSAIGAYMSKLRAPGVTVAVVRDGEIVLERAYGMADLENFAPAKTDTVYRLASVAKPITAIAVMQLVEQRKIDLDAPITRYAPKLSRTYDRVTVRDLLRHTSGVRHYKNDEEFRTLRHCDRLEEAMSVFANDPLEHEPGAAYTYSTFAYTLLGLAVESASGMSFPDYLRRLVFEPAGMKRTVVDDRHEIVPDRSDGYVRMKAGELQNADPGDNTCKIPGGGLSSTVGDLGRLYLALESGKLLKLETFAQMSQNQVPQKVWSDLDAKRGPEFKRYPGFGYGFGWITATPKRPDAVWHGGAGLGATTALYMLPKARIGVVILTNIEGEGDAITQLVDEVGSIVTGVARQ